MIGYLSRLADRLAGGGFDGRFSPSVSAFTGYGRRIAGEKLESEEPVSNAEVPAAEWVSGGFEGRPEPYSKPLDRPMAPAFSELQTVLPTEANSPGAAFRRTSIPTETHADFVAPLETPYGEPGRTKKRSNLVDYGPDMSTNGFPSPANSGLRQQEDPERVAVLQIEGDVSPHTGWREAERFPGHPAGATHWAATAGVVDAVATGAERDRAQSPARTFQEVSHSGPFETAASRHEPADMAETAAIPRLSPRQMIPPPTPPEAPAQPKLVIGRISVEVVRQSEPFLKRPVHAGSREPNRSGTRPSGHDTGPRTNLNFGLGQI